MTDRAVSMTRSALALFALALLAVGCGDGPKPAPPPGAQPPARDSSPGGSVAAGSSGLKPLTSRNGDAPSTAAPTAPALPPGHPPLDAARGAEGPPSADAISGTITIAPNLRDRSSPADALFVIARNAKSHQVLAVRKLDGVRFPQVFQISGANAMVEGTAFVGPFDITGRLSRTGDAMPSKGDIEGTAKGVTAGAKDVALTLDSVRQ